MLVKMFGSVLLALRRRMWAMVIVLLKIENSFYTFFLLFLYVSSFNQVKLTRKKYSLQKHVQKEVILHP